MIHEREVKALLRRLVSKSKEDPMVDIYVVDPYEEECLNTSQNWTDIIEAVMCCDLTHIRFWDRSEGLCRGTMLIVLEYDRHPEEVISDHTANPYTDDLYYHAMGRYL